MRAFISSPLMGDEMDALFLFSGGFSKWKKRSIHLISPRIASTATGGTSEKAAPITMGAITRSNLSQRKSRVLATAVPTVKIVPALAIA